MKKALIALATAVGLNSTANIIKEFHLMRDGMDWAILPNSQPRFPKSKRKKVGKPKSRPSRRQRNKFRRR